MAEITVTNGFVTQWTKANPSHPDWAMRVSEPHSRKKPDGTYEQIGRTYYTLKAAYGVEIDFTQFKENDRVTFTGKQITETTEKDGKTYTNLIVKVETIKKSGVALDSRNTDNLPF